MIRGHPLGASGRRLDLMNLAVARPEEVAQLPDCLVVITPGLTLADTLLSRDLVKALPFEIELE
jgi:hypothetical protein